MNFPATRNPRVLVLNAGGGDGGIETHVIGLAPHLEGEGIELYVGAPAGKFLERVAQAGARPVIASMKHKFDLPSVRRLAGWLRTNDIDIVHAQQERTLLLAWSATRLLPRRNRPLLMQTEHNRTVDRLNCTPDVREMRSSTLAVHKYIARKTAAFIAVSAAIKRLLVDCEGVPESRVTVVPVSVTVGDLQPTATRSAVRQALGLGDAPIVATAAKLTGQKDFPTFLRSAALVLQQRQDVHFLIAGAGPEEAKLRQLAAQLGIEENVHFLGFRSDVIDLLAASDVFLLTSLWEGMPRVVLEAMAVGLPVVATSVSGVPEVVIPGVTGFLADAGATEQIAHYVVELLSDPARAHAMGASGREHVVSGFTEASAAQKIADVYRRLYALRNAVGGRSAAPVAIA